MVVALPWEVAPTLAVGARSSALGAGRLAWLGSFAHPDEALAGLAAAAGVAPELAAVDLRPGDPAHLWAARAGLPVRAVARHHALVAATMAAHGLGPDEQVIGFAFDGGGYGPDGATWGGEVLVAGYKGFRRVAHLGYVRCVGTDRPHRIALAHLRHAGLPWDLDLAPVRACSTRERRILAGQLDSGFGCATTTSVGLLLTTIAALHGRVTAPPGAGHDVRGPVAAVPGAIAGLHGLAGGRAAGGEPYPMRGLDPGALVRAVVADVRAGVPAQAIDARVRATLVALVADQARRCARETGLDVVVLAGDVFDDPALTVEAQGNLPDLTVLAGRPPMALGRLLCAAAG
ncbi:Kae1-like domain-containing protein [Asanoa iriomotensis]|uniref:Uncharacterized protein n=1 Tax=Asanoa iriomotensis TaxID=234613 RepID=A0ABQ4C118_9ACTN|nr:hypothetical protein [Asanoa iriomotensis]GIF56479.1 hypothetical protein Air01nite_25740 [Asanoa iriomotensis]